MQITNLNQSYNQKASVFIKDIMSKEFHIEESEFCKEDLKDLLKNYSGKKNVFYIGIEDDNIIATAGVKEDAGGSALIRRLFVKENKRQHGYGNEILTKAIAFCKKRGYKKIIFRCTNNMAGAINLMLKNGFVEKDIVNMGDYKIYLMEKNLQ